MKVVVKPIEKLRQSYQIMLDSKEEPVGKTLNLALLSNPFIKDQEHFRAIQHQLTLYNKRLLDGFVNDHYEVRAHQRIFAIISDLANMDTQYDMVSRLEESWNWWKEQRRIIMQRKDLGIVKYKTDRQTDRLRQLRERMSKSEVVAQPQVLPNEIRFAELQPFENKYRTAHKEIDIPLKRLAEYKVKRLNLIDSQLKDIQEPRTKQDKVLYPHPKKYVPPEQDHPQNPEAALTQNPGGSSINPEHTDLTNDEQDPNKPTGQIDTNNSPGSVNPSKLPEAEDPNQQDLGGFGEQPGEPEEDGGEQETPQEDKLAPKNKIYTWSNKKRQQYNKQKKYDRPYMFYKGDDSTPEQRMEQRAFLKQQYSLQMKREQEQLINKAHEWATEKQKISKQVQLLLEMRTNKPKYSFSYEDPQKKQLLSLADEKKYGFFSGSKSNYQNEIVLDGKLPRIAQFKPLEREVRRDRLRSLKHKFGSILNLRQSAQEARTNASTLCQSSPRRRDFSMILQEHSLQKEKLRQLQQIQRIKQSLGKQRININIKTLAQALVPDLFDYRQDSFQSPSKQLPNNPFWVEPKKKKKKKK